MSSKLLATASLLIIGLAAASARAQTQNVEEDLTVIGNWMLYSDAENSLYHHFLNQAFELLDARAQKVAALDTRGPIATAPGEACDFVSRFFVPKAGIPEDPVTGSAHCELTPYWAKRLGKTRLVAHQVSARGGELHCEDRGERVIIAGRAVAEDCWV